MNSSRYIFLYLYSLHQQPRCSIICFQPPRGLKKSFLVARKLLCVSWDTEPEDPYFESVSPDDIGALCGREIITDMSDVLFELSSSTETRVLIEL